MTSYIGSPRWKPRNRAAGFCLCMLRPPQRLHAFVRSLREARRTGSVASLVRRGGSSKPIIPGRVSPRRPVPSHIKCPPYAKSGVAREYTGKEAIPIKNADEIETHRKAGAIAAKILTFASGLVGVGVTTEEIDALVHEEIIKHDAYPSPLNYFSFPKSLCTSVNEILCHGIPDSRALEEGDIVNLDITVFHGGVHGDCSATIPVGKITAESAELIETTKNALDVGVRHVQPGRSFQSIGAAIEQYARDRGYAVCAEFVGHGLGSEFHTPPWIVHTAAGGDSRLMAPGMVFTIEPILLRGLSRPRFRIWSDQWTAIATDGRRSAQFEHTVLVTPTGCEILTK